MQNAIVLSLKCSNFSGGQCNTISPFLYELCRTSTNTLKYSLEILKEFHSLLHTHRARKKEVVMDLETEATNVKLLRKLLSESSDQNADL